LEKSKLPSSFWVKPPPSKKKKTSINTGGGMIIEKEGERVIETATQW